MQLWTALDAAVTGGGHTRDAAAWFAIDPAHARVVRQGYVVAPGSASLLYPAVGRHLTAREFRRRAAVRHAAVG